MTPERQRELREIGRLVSERYGTPLSKVSASRPINPAYVRGFQRLRKQAEKVGVKLKLQ